VTLDYFRDPGDGSMDGWSWSLQGRVTDVETLTQQINYAAVNRGLLYESEGTNRGLPVNFATVAERDAVAGKAGTTNYSLLTASLPGGTDNALTGTGNHDYDAMYSDSRWPPTLDITKLNPNDPASIGGLHIGGLDNFRQVFGSNTSFFKHRPWYVSSFHGGTNSAQVFFAEGRPFLHIGLEMDAPNDALAWAAKVIPRFTRLQHN
jgi:hypothetical protein